MSPTRGLLVTGAAEVVTLTGGLRRGPAQDEPAVAPPGTAVACLGGTIVAVAPEAQARDALARYARRRDVRCPQRETGAFLISERGHRLRGSSVRRMFAKLCAGIGLRPPVGPDRRIGRGPRLQDVRHTFATRRLVEWYRAGADVERELPKLAFPPRNGRS